MPMIDRAFPRGFLHRGKLRIIEQCKVDLSAHCGNVGLVEEEPSRALPAPGGAFDLLLI